MTTQPKIAFVQSNWHDDLVGQCKIGFSQEIDGKATADYFVVPGAFEIPLYCQTLARTGNYAAIVAAGLVVDGGIYRHEFVADAVIKGLMDVQIAEGVPVFSSVLTPKNFHETADHIGFFHGHLHKKGVEVARACLATLDSRALISAGS